MLLSAADELLEPLEQIDGFRLASLVDASTGMVLAARHDQADLSLSSSAASAADIASVLAMLSSELGADDALEDVMVTFGKHFHLIRVVEAGSPQQVILLVVLDRQRANLAMARREIRKFCEGMAG